MIDDMKIFLIYSILSILLASGIAWHTGYFYGQKSRSVIIKYGDIQCKIPEILDKAEIPYTSDQIHKVNQEFIKKDAVGFKP
jgi:hypothetical protein